MTMEALYPTKKALKESVGKRLKYRETSNFGIQYKSNGTITVADGFTGKRKWFANVTMKDDLIAKVS